jgi:flagellar basal body-associated protein FliL
MKLIVILVVVVVLLAGGGGGVYFFRDALFGGESAPKKAEIAKAADVVFVDLESLTVAVIRNSRIEKHVVLQVSLEVPDEATRANVAKALPRLKDAFIKDLYDYYAVRTPGSDGINVEGIKKRLKRTSDLIMGEGVIRAVLIQGAVERETSDK